MKEKPKVVVSDGLRAYQKAFKKEFFTLRKPRTKHVRMPRFVDRTNNNMVERLNGTVRERDKVMRGMKKEETATQDIGFGEVKVELYTRFSIFRAHFCFYVT